MFGATRVHIPDPSVVVDEFQPWKYNPACASGSVDFFFLMTPSPPRLGLSPLLPARGKVIDISANCQPPAARPGSPQLPWSAIPVEIIPITTVLTLPSEIATASPNTDGSTDGPAVGMQRRLLRPWLSPYRIQFCQTTRLTSLGHAKPADHLSIPEAPGPNEARVSCRHIALLRPICSTPRPTLRRIAVVLPEP